MPRLVSRFSASLSLLHVLNGRDISAFWRHALVTWIVARRWRERARFVLRRCRKAARVSMESIEGRKNSWPLLRGRGLVRLAGLGITDCRFTRSSSGVLCWHYFMESWSRGDLALWFSDRKENQPTMVDYLSAVVDLGRVDSLRISIPNP